MPALPFATPLLNTLVDRDVISSTAASNSTNGTALQVVCAWPVSGQYGPGTRVLYYVLIAACVFARKSEWMRNACLAAVLLFPAVAALHGIVLAAVHVDGAVDMDVYGAFQICSIGIMTAPVTVRRSRTYFDDPGRNIIFLWTGLILAGLLSLTVEFFRIKTSSCFHDDSGNPVSLDSGKFFYGTSCGLTCSPEDGPFSPMRSGSVSDINVIPAPNKLTFSTATLIAAACCIPAILSLVFMWDKILEINWKRSFGGGNGNERMDEPIEGTNGATIGKMKGVNSLIRKFLSTVEIPVFGAAVVAILIMGELNFFSFQLRYETEPIASIGQWAPIVGTGLAVLGSLYLFLAVDLEKESDSNTSMHQCNCSMHGVGNCLSPTSSRSVASPWGTDMRRSLSNGDRGTSGEIVPTTSRPTSRRSYQLTRSVTAGTADTGNRRKVAMALTAVSNYLGTAAPDRFDDSEFKHGKALDFPEIPGEELRNRALPQIREQYNTGRDANGNATSSRAGSFISSAASGRDVEGSSTTSRATSPQRSMPSSTPQRPLPSALPVERTSFDLQNPFPSSPPGSTGITPRPRRDTLEVPVPAHHGSVRNNSSPSPVVSVAEGQRSPAIVVSSDPSTFSPTSPSTSEPPPPS